MNFRLLLNIALITVLTACGGAEERKSVYMEKALSSIEAGDFDKARIELKNVLQIAPKDGEALYLLGSVYEQQNDYRKAFSHYRKAEELNPELLKNQAKLGRFYLLLVDDFEKTQEKIDFILSKEPTNPEGLLLKAALKMKSNKEREAITITKNILAKNPGHAESAAFLASIYLGDKKIEDSINVLDAALIANQNNEKINRLLALALVRNKNYERAENIYKKFLDGNPNNSTSYNNLAVFYNVSGNGAKAKETLLASIDNDPNDEDRILTYIKFIKTTKDNESAISELKKYIEKKGGIGMLRNALAELYILTGDKSAAIDVYKKSIIDFSEEVTGIKSRLALASLYLSENSYEEAKVVIDEAVSISPNDPEVNYLKAKFAVRDKNYEEAIISLRIVIRETPENIDAFILLARVYQEEGNKEQANSTLNSAYESNKHTPLALLKLAQFYMSVDIKKAEKIIDAHNSIAKSDYDGLSLKASILNKNKNFSEANVIAKKLMELYPGKANGYLQAMLYHGENDNKKEAISILEKGYLNVEDNRKILTLLTTFQVIDKNYDIVKKRIKAEIDASPNDAELKMLLAKVHVYENDFESAETYLKAALEVEFSVEEPYLLLAQIYNKKGDLNSVKEILIKGSNNVPTSIKIPLKLVNLYEKEESYADVIRIYKKINKVNPDNLIIINNLASILSDNGNGTTDLQLAKGLVVKLQEQEQSVFLDTTGWVYYKLGNYETAISYLTKAVEKDGNINIFNYHLGMAYKMLGDKSRAKEFLEKSLINAERFKEKNLAETALKNI